MRTKRVGIICAICIILCGLTAIAILRKGSDNQKSINEDAIVVESVTEDSDVLIESNEEVSGDLEHLIDWEEDEVDNHEEESSDETNETTETSKSIEIDKSTESEEFKDNNTLGELDFDF